MSTKSSIGLTGKVHFYSECMGEGVFVQRDDPWECIKVMDQECWDEIEDQIIAKRLCQIQNGTAKLPKQIWDADGYLNKERLIKHFIAALEKVPK